MAEDPGSWSLWVCIVLALAREQVCDCTAVDEEIRSPAASHDPPLTAEHASTFTLTDLGNYLSVQLTITHTHTLSHTNTHADGHHAQLCLLDQYLCYSRL